MTSYPLIVSYYTLGSFYEKEARNLIAFCERLQLECLVEGIEDRGSWEKNCCYKPKFILERLLKYKHPLLWVDADALIFKRGDLLLSLREVDVAARYFSRFSEMLTGTLYFNYTNEALLFLKKWRERCLKGKCKNGDQYYFNREIASNKQIKRSDLPAEYAYIVGEEKTFPKEAVIVHYQASRLQKLILDEPCIKMALEHLSGEQQKMLREINSFPLSDLPNLISFLSNLNL